eukprot:gene5556-6118_t
MGGDGGVIATKRQFVRGAKKANEESNQKLSRNQEQHLRATTCCLSGERLSDPIVCCELGNLFNKDAILQALLEKRLAHGGLSHIRGLKDLKALKFTPLVHDNRQDGDADPCLFMCPVTNQEFNGLYPFYVIWTTGWVISEKAIKELGIESLQSEYGPFTEQDLVRLIPQDIEMDAQRAAMHDRRAAAKASKKAHSKDKKENGDDGEKGKKRKKDVAEQEEHDRDEQLPQRTKLSSSLLEEVSKNVQDQQKGSEIYKKLFHKDGEKDRTDRDLFMTVAGIRYTLG